MNNFNQLYLITILLSISLFIQLNMNAQTRSGIDIAGDNNTYEKGTAAVLRSKYLDNQGSPSYKEFLLTNNIYPTIIEQKLKPYFRISINRNAISLNNNNIESINTSEIFNIDFYIQHINKVKSLKNVKNILDGRVYEENNELIVGGYSSIYNERPVGKINYKGEFILSSENELNEHFPILSLSQNEILFDPFNFKLLKIVENSSEFIEEVSQEYLPIDIYNKETGFLYDLNYSFEFDQKESLLKLVGSLDALKIDIAICKILKAEIIEVIEAYQPELNDGCVQSGMGEIVTLILEGRFSDDITTSDGIIFLNDKVLPNSLNKKANEKIIIDGNFSDWYNVKGLSDYLGDRVSYLFPNPDTDLLQFKVTNDDKYLYLYSRVAGAHGRTGEKGRYYWYAYIDVDSDPNTGYPPTRDDNCYFGIPIGDDCEAQFEFVGNRFIKTFFGFTGIGNEKEVLQGKLTLGPSYYSPNDKYGNKRENYKIEYVNKDGSRFITHDYTEGTSEDIIIGLSADASEVEMRVELKGFLTDINNNPLVKKGTMIDIAVGVEASSDYYDSNRWGADSTPILYGYEIK